MLWQLVVRQGKEFKEYPYQDNSLCQFLIASS